MRSGMGTHGSGSYFRVHAITDRDQADMDGAMDGNTLRWSKWSFREMVGGSAFNHSSVNLDEAGFDATSSPG
jgi:hypothetical protein